ncbi:MAG TPA: oxygenase MpaB family protein [Amycolatopsis sp.]|uniref:Oxygenase MpaB family protein n=1 Tax=Amycolatopsis nalaikhensis TaxID=715472 RepID=A0ABY8XYE1_9PSEU|nr:oxygenase MpaB family protein [Amycolatopsis sp. 2-2]WIV60571.1 oxygenase MpaB family protein [Amycolatopsis sp. 2-2]
MAETALRDAVVGAGLLAGSANVIMQLSRAPVGYGVLESKVDSGNLFRHPLKRTRTTLTYLAVATMGTDAERAAYRRGVNQAHAQVHSTASSPVAYNAFDTDLQLWVAACLYKGFEDVYLAFVGGDPERFYGEAAALGTTLQVHPEMWPADRAAFEEYWAAGLAEVGIDDTVRRYLTDIVDLRFVHPVLAAPARRFHRFVTTGFLPQRFRDEMRLPWTEADQRRFDALLAAIGRVVKVLPPPLRRFPFNACLWDLRWRLRTGRPPV